MKIREQMQAVVAELVSENGPGYEISAQELKQLLVSRYGTKEYCVIPPDYCYNRVNKGITFTTTTLPRLLVRVDRGMYQCLGENYPFDGPVYTQPKGTKAEIIVGRWENGVFTPNANWDLYCLK